MLGVATKKAFLSHVARQTLLIKTCSYSQDLENKYSDSQKEKILQIINDNDGDNLSRYNITKLKLKKITERVKKSGHIKTISDIGMIDGFTEKYAKKFCDSILDGPEDKEQNHIKKIKGQILHPPMTELVRKNCKTVLAVYIIANSVCWTLIDRNNYELVKWEYKPILYPSGRSIKISDILQIAWRITEELPAADIYVMKGEATSLRASGSDPNNSKAMGVNLQKAQMISMIVALINARANEFGLHNDKVREAVKQLSQKVYFLRPTLPYRLYGTLVGNERVSTDQTVELLLQKTRDANDRAQLYVPDHLKSMFRSQKDLQQDMLGQCLLLAITFMDVCVFMNKDIVEKLVKRDE